MFYLIRPVLIIKLSHLESKLHFVKFCFLDFFFSILSEVNNKIAVSKYEQFHLAFDILHL
jgi:hypothetical protein